MSGIHRMHADERGLVSRILVLWLVLAALLAVLVYDEMDRRHEVPGWPTPRRAPPSRAR